MTDGDSMAGFIHTTVGLDDVSDDDPLDTEDRPVEDDVISQMAASLSQDFAPRRHAERDPLMATPLRAAWTDHFLASDTSSSALAVAYITMSS